MNVCQHPLLWKFTKVSISKCFICIIEFLENNENPMVCKERVLEELLMHINCTAEEYFSIFEENEEVLLHTIGVLVELFYKFNHVFLLDIFCEVLLKFDQVFGDMIFDVIFSFTESLCLPCSNFKNHKSFLSFILNLLKSKQSFADKFALSGSFISYVFSGIACPDDELREVLLDICLCLIARCADLSFPLTDFQQLPSALLKLFLNSKSIPMLKTAFQILSETAKASYFSEWFNDNVFVETVMFEGSKLVGICHLFAAIKKVVLMQQNALNLSILQAINNMLQHEELVQTFLDSDLAELIYDALCSSLDCQLIAAIFDCILLLSRNEEFFISCHAMYGIKPLCTSLSSLLHEKNILLTCSGFQVLQILCDKQTSDVSILPTLSLFDLFLQVICDGMKSENLVVMSHATATSCSLLKHIPYPLPFKDLTTLYETIEEQLSKEISKDASLSQCQDEEMLNYSESALSSVLQLIEKCIRISSYEANAKDGHSMGEFTDLLLHSLYKVWVPIIKKDEKLTSSINVMESCFKCLLAILESNKMFSLKIWEHTIAEGFLEIAIKLKNETLNDKNFECLNDVTNDLLFELSLPLLHLLDCTEFTGAVKKGLFSISGNPSELIHYLNQRAIKPSGELDHCLLSLQCSVLTLISLSTWQTSCFSSFEEVNDILTLHESLHKDVNDLPLIFMKLKFFLFCICQQEVIPEFPPDLIRKLSDVESLIILHPAVLSSVLRCSDHVISNQIKIKLVCSWVEQIDFVEFLNMSESKHLVGLILLYNEVATIVLKALSSCNDSAIFNKLLLILTSAVEESVGEIGNSFSYEDEANLLHSLVARRLPDIVNLDYDYIIQVPKIVVVSLLRLLLTLSKKSFLSDDVVLHRPRLLRKVISLLVNGLKSPRSCDTFDDEIITYLLDIIDAMLDKVGNSQSITAELSLIFSNCKLLQTIEALLNQPIKNFQLRNVHSSSFKLLSTFIRHERESSVDVEYSIKYKVEDLLKFVEGNFDQNLQTSVLHLWQSLFQIKFQSLIFCLIPIVGTKNQLLTKNEVFLAPLNRDLIVRFFLFVMNCSAKGFPGIRRVSLQCLLTIFTFIRSCTDLFTELASSPWIHFILDPIQCENCLEKDLCAALADAVKL